MSASTQVTDEVRLAPGPTAVPPPAPAAGEGAHLWRYIPTLALVRGFGSALALSTTATLLKSLNVDNATIGYLSLLALPATVKFLWAPFADSYGTKRQWALAAAFGMAGSLLFLSGVLFLPGTSIMPLVLGCAVIALVYAVSDFANEGFFVCAVPPSVRVVAVAMLTVIARIATVTLSGVIFLAGIFGDRFHSIQTGWATAFGIFGVAVVFLAFVSVAVFPRPVADRPTRSVGGPVPWREAFQTYLETPRFWYMVAFVIMFRFGECVILRMGQVFWIEGAATGGLALSLQQVSFVGVMATSSALIGGALSGVLVKRYGVRRTMVPMSLAMLAPNLLYVLIALYPSYHGIDVRIFGLTGHIPRLRW